MARTVGSSARRRSYRNSSSGGFLTKLVEGIAEAAGFDAELGSGIAMQIAIEDAVGLSSQILELTKKV
jgi:hypothetical protein